MTLRGVRISKFSASVICLEFFLWSSQDYRFKKEPNLKYSTFTYSREECIPSMRSVAVVLNVTTWLILAVRLSSWELIPAQCSLSLPLHSMLFGKKIILTPRLSYFSFSPQYRNYLKSFCTGNLNFLQSLVFDKIVITIIISWLFILYLFHNYYYSFDCSYYFNFDHWEFQPLVPVSFWHAAIICVYVHTCEYEFVFAYMSVRACVCLCAWMCVYTHVCKYAHVYMFV